MKTFFSVDYDGTIWHAWCNRGTVFCSDGQWLYEASPLVDSTNGVRYTWHDKRGNRVPRKVKAAIAGSGIERIQVDWAAAPSLNVAKLWPV